MKSIVIYNSKTGFTKRYGEWIAEEIGCKSYSQKEAPKQLDAYDCIIFGGWIMAGKVSGLDKIKKNPTMVGKQLIVYATGATAHDADTIICKFQQDNLTQAEQEQIPFYYMESGINYETMGFFSKTILKTMKKMLQGKKNRTEEEEGMLQTFIASSDHSDKKYIEPLIEYVKKM